VQTVGDSRERAKFLEKNSQLSIRRQCSLLQIPRSLVYYELSGESEENLKIMRAIDKLHMDDPSAGSRRMNCYINRQTETKISRKRIRRLMQVMGVEAVYPQKRTTIPGGPSGIHPYKLKGLKIDHPNQVWCADITFIPMRRGFMYLFAIMDWYSRKIIAWELSNTLDTDFCLAALKRALEKFGIPEIMNTDQGCQFTSDEWIKSLQSSGITISMDGKGRWLDNVAIERFWRSIKYEDIYLKSYENARELEYGINEYMHRYNWHRPHQSLENRTPEEIYTGKRALAA
jgi:putative transposase